jgi:hypothetical protein
MFAIGELVHAYKAGRARMNLDCTDGTAFA